MRHGWAFLLLAGCDCLVGPLEVTGTVTSPAEPRVWLCSEEPPEGRDADRFRRCVEGTVGGGGESWSYTVAHSPGPGGESECYTMNFLVFEADGCARRVEPLEGASAGDTGGSVLSTTLDCAQATE